MSGKGGERGQPARFDPVTGDVHGSGSGAGGGGNPDEDYDDDPAAGFERPPGAIKPSMKPARDAGA
jgi:hypothetical protein